MHGILNFIKNWVLIICLMIGCLGHEFFIDYADKTMYLIFVMLFFTFCRIDPSQLRFRKVHAIFLAIQIVGSVFLYYVLSYLGHKEIAESTMMCLLAPTAAASAVVTMKLGGDGASNTTYVLLSSLAVAILVPIWFPLIHPQGEGLSFWWACWGILRKVLPVLVGPFLLAMLVKRFSPVFHAKISRWHEVSFYLWAICLVFAAAQMVVAIEKSHFGMSLTVLLALISALLCGLQFFLGKRLGKHYGDSISGGQSLGQKNIILAIWIASMFLSDGNGDTPMAIVGLGTYIIWQNLVNSWQLYRKRVKDAGGQLSHTEMIP